jgi:hypothetical protein
MRKAFKVATVFTGGVACAAAFTPALAANAATNAETGTGTTQAPLDVIDCPTHPNTSVHLYWSPGENHPPTCVGNHQVYTGFGHVHYISLCAGNNSGVFSSVYDRVVYRPGGYYGLGNGTAEKIDNIAWSGNAECSYS